MPEIAPLSMNGQNKIEKSAPLLLYYRAPIDDIRLHTKDVSKVNTCRTADPSLVPQLPPRIYSCHEAFAVFLGGSRYHLNLRLNCLVTAAVLLV